MSDMAEVYLQFVVNRHQVYERRQSGEEWPWSDDPILNGYKFTNVFRAIDYGSQFLIREMLYGEDREEQTFADALMRCFLYRYTNRPEPWEYFYQEHGRYPVQKDLSGLLAETWGRYKDEGQAVFGNAYKMFVGKENAGTDRLTWALNLTKDYFHIDSPRYIVPEFAMLSSMEERLALLRTIPRCANFMAMQIVTDIGYSPFVQGDEDEHVVPGPGARIGAKEIDPDRRPLEVIAWAQEEVHNRPLTPAVALPQGGYRTPSLMDIQNTLCEFGKYVRYRRGTGPVRIFRPNHPGPLPDLVLPEHW